MLGYESEVVNGQLVNVAPKAAFDPLIFGAVFAPGGMWPRQGVYNVPPIIPNAANTGGMLTDQGYAMGAQSGQFPTNVSETGNPFHLTKSPVIWALAFLAFSLAMLHFVHYKG